MPLANALVRPEHRDRPDARFPLDVVRCRACGLLQLACSVSPEVLFREYVYFSSYSETFLQHVEHLVSEICAARALGNDSLVVEIASNDGYLLQYYKQRGVRVLGVEPAENIARVARDTRAIPTLAEFFGPELAGRLVQEGVRADVVHAHNVIAHVPDLLDVLRGIRDLLKLDGIVVIEVPYVLDMVDKLEFDTIYHEHLCYFSLSALRHAFDRAGLEVADVRRVPIHGGSIRVFGRRKDAVSAPDIDGQRRVGDMLAAEQHWGILENAPYRRFAEGVVSIRESLRALLSRLKAEGNSIAAYGAAAKGAVLMNYCGIGHEFVDFVVDRSAAKHGLLTPGTRLMIYPPERLLEVRPDYVLLLAWNLADEVMAQQAGYRRAGGKFIIPVPTVRVA